MSSEQPDKNASVTGDALTDSQNTLPVGVSAENAVPRKKTTTHDSMKTLVLGALGVVYGDIGTSPIYAFREALHAATSDGFLSRSDILGVVSLIFWALLLVVTVKYVIFVLRADNNGEGGILSLMALVRAALKGGPTSFWPPVFAVLRCFW